MGVLVAVSIPIFTSQLKKAKLATNQANARAAYAAAVSAYLTDDNVTGGSYATGTGVFTNGGTVTGNNINIIDTPIATWTVDNQTDFANQTYNNWGVSLNNGTVETLTYN